MKYELNIFESLVEKALNPSGSIGEKLHATDFTEQKTTADTEVVRIKKAFIDEAFSLERDKLVEKYIQQHQSSLIRLCNKLLQHISLAQFNVSHMQEKVYSLPDLCFYFYSKLEHILNFIEGYFTKYFNQDENIPASYRIIGQLEFRKKIKAFDFPEKCKLMEIALYPIYKFINQNSPVTYRNLIYLKELLKMITDICPKCKEMKPNCKLKNTLIYLNFNNFKFFTHLTLNITNDYQGEETASKQIEKISFYLKKLNQAQTKPDFALKTKQTSIKEQMITWLLEEMAFIEKRHQLTLNFQNGVKDDVTKDFKLITDLSVPQVAYFIRILVETGIIQNKNHKELLTFFANYIKTKKTQNISPDSFRSKYYNVEESARKAVRDVVIKLVNETQNRN
ncbi:MAG: hypothetical protein KAQ75_12940 [Bacteroidales bacterium]|nr:hypothetical protein [Bacteroidales bacterium]